MKRVRSIPIAPFKYIYPEQTEGIFCRVRNKNHQYIGIHGYQKKSHWEFPVISGELTLYSYLPYYTNKLKNYPKIQKANDATEFLNKKVLGIYLSDNSKSMLLYKIGRNKIWITTSIYLTQVVVLSMMESSNPNENEINPATFIPFYLLVGSVLWKRDALFFKAIKSYNCLE